MFLEVTFESSDGKLSKIAHYLQVSFLFLGIQPYFSNEVQPIEYKNVSFPLFYRG